jgi:hypothetical protein
MHPSGAPARLRRGLLLAPLTMGIVAAWPASAPALITHLPGKTLSYQPVPGSSPQAKARPFANAKPKSGTALQYHGGPVMTSNTNYTFYWAPSGAPAYPAGYEAGLNRYFEDLAVDSGGVQNTDSVLVQYGATGGQFANYNSHFGGALIDTTPYPANGCKAAAICFTDEQLRAEIAKYVQAGKLPADLQHQYFLLTPPGVESCFEAAGKSCSAGAQHSAFCAYHGDIPVTGGVIVYANDPYVNGLNCDFGEQHPNNNPSDATIGGGLAHEHSEAVTDPELNAWSDSKGREVGDKCRTFVEATEFGPALGTASNGAKYNQVLNTHLYYYQQEWSNATGACQQRATVQPPAVTKVAPASGPRGGGTSVTITGTGFSNPATVNFGSNPATGVTVQSATTITAVSPAGSKGLVNLTVTTSAGTSAINKKAHFKYK